MTSLGVVAHTIEDDEEWLIKLWEVNYIMSYDILYNFSMRWAIVLSSKKEGKYTPGQRRVLLKT